MVSSESASRPEREHRRAVRDRVANEHDEEKGQERRERPLVLTTIIILIILVVVVHNISRVKDVSKK